MQELQNRNTLQFNQNNVEGRQFSWGNDAEMEANLTDIRESKVPMCAQNRMIKANHLTIHQG
jgi:hypothetical protein